MEEKQLRLVLGTLVCLSSTSSNLGWHLLLLVRSWQRGHASPFCSRPCDVLPGKSLDTKNNWEIADGVSSLCVLVELARRLTLARTTAACGWLLLGPAGQGQESAGLQNRTWRSQHLGITPWLHCQDW